MKPSLIISDRMLDFPSIYLVYTWESKGEFGIRSQVTWVVILCPYSFIYLFIKDKWSSKLSIVHDLIWAMYFLSGKFLLC